MTEQTKVKISFVRGRKLTEEVLISGLEVILGKTVRHREKEILEALIEAGERTKISTKDIKPGCGAVVIEEVFYKIAEKYNG